MRKRMNWIDWAGARKNMRRDESRLYNGKSLTD